MSARAPAFHFGRPTGISPPSTSAPARSHHTTRQVSRKSGGLVEVELGPSGDANLKRARVPSPEPLEDAPEPTDDAEVRVSKQARINGPAEELQLPSGEALSYLTPRDRDFVKEIGQRNSKWTGKVNRISGVILVNETIPVPVNANLYNVIELLALYLRAARDGNVAVFEQLLAYFDGLRLKVPEGMTVGSGLQLLFDALQQSRLAYAATTSQLAIAFNRFGLQAPSEMSNDLAVAYLCDSIADKLRDTCVRSASRHLLLLRDISQGCIRINQKKIQRLSAELEAKDAQIEETEERLDEAGVELSMQDDEIASQDDALVASHESISALNNTLLRKRWALAGERAANLAMRRELDAETDAHAVTRRERQAALDERAHQQQEFSAQALALGQHITAFVNAAQLGAN
ncbi:unnamed protein product [Peniophora sp. CBMAI 1063]|nr:unnamed protein product [Peniophora sp. CBMAI 1063]